MKTLRHVVWSMARTYPGGGRQLAADIGRGGKVMEQKLGLHDDAHIMNINELELVAEAVRGGEMAIAQHFADKTNAVVIPLPDRDRFGDMALLDGFMQIMREIGELARTFQDSYADGIITNVEFESIAQEVRAVQAKLLEFQHMIHRVVPSA